MRQQSRTRKPPPATEIPADEARACLGDLLDRAGFKGERIAITRHKKRIAFLIGVDELARLEGAA